MKKIKEIFRPYMMRPMIYSSVTRFSIGLVVALLWDRFINTEGFFSVAEYAFVVVGVFMLVLAWTTYLQIDGISLKFFNKELFAKKKKTRHFGKDMVDFVDEKVTTYDELDVDEQVVCRLGANVITGTVFLLISLVATLFG